MLAPGEVMYYIVEILRSTVSKTVGQFEELEMARRAAYRQSAKSGLKVEVRNEINHVVDSFMAWTEYDY